MFEVRPIRRMEIAQDETKSTSEIPGVEPLTRFGFEIPEIAPDDLRYKQFEANLVLDALHCFKTFSVLVEQNPLTPDSFKRPEAQKATPDEQDPSHAERVLVQVRRFKTLAEQMGPFGKPGTISLRQGWELQNTTHEVTKMLDEEYPLDKHPRVSYQSIQVTQANQLDDIREFYDYINHELRTPLTSIMGFLQLLVRQSNPDSPEFAERLARLNSQFEVMQKFIEEGAEPLIKNSFETSSMPVAVIENYAKQALKDGLAGEANRHVSVDVVNFVDPDLPLLGNDQRLIELHLQIGRNTGRIYNAKEESDPERFISEPRMILAVFEKANATTKARYKLAPNIDYVIETIEDRALGFPTTPDGHHIPTHGYKKGKTYYGETSVTEQGSGRAMAHIVRVLGFDGIKVVPEDVLDDEGKKIGARHRVFYPVQKQSNVTTTDATQE